MKQLLHYHSSHVRTCPIGYWYIYSICYVITSPIGYYVYSAMWSLALLAFGIFTYWLAICGYQHWGNV